MSGKPPASEMMPGRERVAMRSRVTAVFMPLTRSEYRKSNRSRSTSGNYTPPSFTKVSTFSQPRSSERTCQSSGAISKRLVLQRRPRTREGLEVLVPGGQGLLARHGPDHVRLLHYRVRDEYRPDPFHQARPRPRARRGSRWSRRGAPRASARGRSRGQARPCRSPSGRSRSRAFWRGIRDRVLWRAAPRAPRRWALRRRGRWRGGVPRSPSGTRCAADQRWPRA